MANIRFGVIYSRLHAVTPIPEFARAIEDWGFDAVWVTEGVANQMAALDPLLAVGAFAHHTRRIKVGTCVLLLPLRNPALLAKEVATLDFLSEGRIVLGVGVGGSSNSGITDFHVCNVPVDERGARSDEALEIMTKLWTGKPVSHEGRFYQFQDVKMEPRPVQEPHPPLWVGGQAEGVLKRTARYCDGFVPMGVTPKEYGRMWTRIEGYGEEYGRDVSGLTRAVHLYFSIGRDREDAWKIARDTLAKRYGWDPQLPKDGRYAFGAARDCIETIEEFVDAGVTDFVFNTTRPLPEVLEHVEQLATEIMPHFN